MPAMTFEETVRILCEPDTHYSQFERAIPLFGFQSQQFRRPSPSSPKMANYTRR
jgi:hypothetical protein